MLYTAYFMTVTTGLLHCNRTVIRDRYVMLRCSQGRIKAQAN